VLLLPIAAFRRTREQAAIGLWVAAFVLFVSLWVMGLYATVVNWGWIGVVVGLLLVASELRLPESSRV
jgi:hypothetical protein